MILLYLIGVVLLNVPARASNTTVDVIPDSFVRLSESAGNNLWTSLLRNCKHPTFSCVKDTVYDYLEDTLEYPDDFQVTSFLKFSKNDVNFTDISSKVVSEDDTSQTDEDGEDNDNELDDDDDITPIEEVSRALHAKSVKFLMTHDVELQLPETFFEGSTLKISPRTFSDNGTEVGMEFLPKEVKDIADARLFKKIKKFITDRLLYALLAILLVIKLLSTKFLFLMPMMVGMAAAKKLLIKVLLFIFPFLHHLFKLCPYVPHGTKYHHHKHHISHLHHIKGHGYPHLAHDTHGPHGYSDGVEVIRPHADGPPIYGGSSIHHFADVEPPHKHSYNPHEQELEYVAGGPQLTHHLPIYGGSSVHHFADVEPPHKHSYNPHEQELEYVAGGPQLTHHFLTHRDDDGSSGEVAGWGQGQTKRKKPTHGRLSATEIENMVLRAEKEALIKARLQQEKLKIEEENKRLQEQLKHALRLQDKLKQKQTLLHSRISNTVSGPPGLGPAPGVPPIQSSPPSQFLKAPPTTNAVPKPAQHIPHTQLQVPPSPGAQSAAQKVYNQIQKDHQGGQNKLADQKQPTSTNMKAVATPSPQKEFEHAFYQAATITYDKFYSPILERIDKILDNLGFNDEGCKERLICSMYKNPVSYSPHSNLLSAELSRDSKELEKPKSTNAVVIRFYRYVQAARDGQDKRDCLRLYASCPVNTEKK